MYYGDVDGVQGFVCVESETLASKDERERVSTINDELQFIKKKKARRNRIMQNHKGRERERERER